MSANDTHGSLAEALAAFQGEDGLTFPKTKEAKVKDRDGRFLYAYRYADLGDILPVVRPLLSKHGLSWRAKPILTDSGDMHLWYRLEHVSGETDTGQMPMGVKADCKPQDLGSAITYARRYALTAQLNLATEEDDDAQGAQDAAGAQAASNGSGNGQPVATAPKPSERHLSDAQKRLLHARVSAAELSATQFANVLLLATGEATREWPDEEAAKRWVDRQVDRLPARLVDDVLEGIAACPPS